MKAARYYDRGDIRVEDIAEPTVEAGSVGIDVAWCGICGTDLHEYRAIQVLVQIGSTNAAPGDVDAHRAGLNHRLVDIFNANVATIEIPCCLHICSRLFFGENVGYYRQTKPTANNQA